MDPYNRVTIAITALILAIAATICLIANRRPESALAQRWHAWSRRGKPSRLTPQQRRRWDGWMAGVFGLMSGALWLRIAILSRPGLGAALYPVLWAALGLAGVGFIAGLVQTGRSKE